MAAREEGWWPENPPRSQGVCWPGLRPVPGWLGTGWRSWSAWAGWRRCTARATSGWAGDLLLRVNPVTAGEHYIGRIVVNGRGWSEDVAWLASPVVAAAMFAALALAVGARQLSLRGGASA